jgi:hypothetical protein
MTINIISPKKSPQLNETKTDNIDAENKIIIHICIYLFMKLFTLISDFSM